MNVEADCLFMFWNSDKSVCLGYPLWGSTSMVLSLKWMVGKVRVMLPRLLALLWAPSGGVAVAPWWAAVAKPVVPSPAGTVVALAVEAWGLQDTHLQGADAVAQTSMLQALALQAACPPCPKAERKYHWVQLAQPQQVRRLHQPQDILPAASLMAPSNVG